jgi:hypothetical protein
MTMLNLIFAVVGALGSISLIALLIKFGLR